MALVARSNPSLEGASAAIVPPVVALMAETINALAPCGLNGSGEIIMSDATGANAAAQFLGVSPRAGVAGQPGSLYGVGTQFEWTDAGTLVPGATYFVAATAGGIDDTATIGDSAGSFVAITTKVLQVIAVRGVGA